ncbi:MAG: tRNA (adenosine(37)-N6)-threonylcarbamoyltransferase complex ATPase subunit type 1 TsaE [Planctomycetes bacterium]|nr:tRNA (adenosine(37)-N6)-threonylcarbamoyltransferase complex ATPase subunit type 1 TsaE [Planctomycetota bacterium]
MQPDKPLSPPQSGGEDPEIFQTSSPRATEMLGRKLAGRFQTGDCVALDGPLGAGKTVLVRGIAAGLALADTRVVSSPTYVLVQEYPCCPTLYHVDLYRLDQPADRELEGLGLDEMLTDGIVVIEWANRAAGALPHTHWQIDIRIKAPRKRVFTVRRVT